jgi:tyrosyl-tRNA synthetase
MMPFDLKSLEQRLLAPVPDLSGLSAQEQFDLIKEKAAAGSSIVTEGQLLARLKESKAKGAPLKFKLGIDPTGPDIHIGHAISLINLRRIHRMGHAIQFVIGDFTAMVGDPGGRMDSRPPLTREGVERNMASYEAQAGSVLDLKAERVTRHYNSEWLAPLTLTDWLRITSKIGVSQLLQREDFRTRLDGGLPLSLAEAEYALLMGYDSVVLKSDVEVGGMDQFLNFHFCRNMMEAAGQAPESFVCFDLLPGTTGEKDEQGRLRKMSKSRGNYIPLGAAAADKYGKVMSVPDDVMWIWFREITEIRAGELAQLRTEVESGAMHPKDAKHLLARVVTATFHGYDLKLVAEAEEAFKGKFGKAAQLVPDDAKEVKLNPAQKVADALREALGESNAQLRRLVAQKGLQWLQGDAYVALAEADLALASAALDGKAVKVGKQRYFKFSK